MTSPLQEFADHARAAQAAIQAQRDSAARIAADVVAAREQAQQAQQLAQAQQQTAGQGQVAGG